LGRREYCISVTYQIHITRQEVIVGPENKTVVSKDNFLRVNLIGDYVRYQSLPTFEDFYLVTPRKVISKL
jgi:hypothetical protein